MDRANHYSIGSLLEFFLEEFFGRNCLFTFLNLFEYGRNLIVSQDFFTLKKEGGGGRTII